MSDHQGPQVYYGQEDLGVNMSTQQPGGRHGYEGSLDPLATGYPQGRRKSLSIIQNITHSATQKFRTFIHTPGLRRRRTVMSLSPITMERESFSGEATDEDEKGVEEREGVQEYEESGR